MEINKKTIERLSELARIKLTEHEEEKLLGDLQKILEYFNELKEVNTDAVRPMTGGTQLANVFREDEERANTNRGAGTEAFPEPKNPNGFLEIPNVFER